mgnify:CR=1 FL=1
MALTILCVSFTLLLLLGVPVAFSIGLSSLATLLFEGLPLAVGFQQMISGMNPFSFLAIPFFIFAGEIMMYGGIADKIVDFAKSLAGHVRGGLGMSNVSDIKVRRVNTGTFENNRAALGDRIAAAELDIEATLQHFGVKFAINVVSVKDKVIHQEIVLVDRKD